MKKTVNQDDIQTYHSFFADDLNSADYFAERFAGQLLEVEATMSVKKMNEEIR